MPSEKSLANLRKFTPEGARVGQAKGVQTKMLNKEIREAFRRNAEQFAAILQDIPALSSLDVIRMCIHMALQENNYEDAARWAKELAEYEKPKLQRIESIVRNNTKDLTDEELERQIKEEGLD